MLFNCFSLATEKIRLEFFFYFPAKIFCGSFFQTSLLEMSRVVWRQHQQQQNLTTSTSTAPTSTSMMPPDDAPYPALNHPSGLSLSNCPLALVKLFLRRPIRATQWASTYNPFYDFALHKSYEKNLSAILIHGTWINLAIFLSSDLNTHHLHSWETALI